MTLPLLSTRKPLPAALASGGVPNLSLGRQSLDSLTTSATNDGWVWSSNPVMLVEGPAAAGAVLVSIEKSRCGSGAELHPMSTRIADTQIELRKDATWHIHHE
jgi:hypothetical protein